MKLSIQQIYDAARQAGFTPDQATTWTAIALAESGGNTGALNPVGEHSVGLWQINLQAHDDKWGDLNDPLNNARAAYEVSRGGLDMRPWTVTHASNQGTERDYRTYLDDVSAVTGYTGDPRGVEGYGSPLPEPLPPSGPDQPDVAAQGSPLPDASASGLAGDPQTDTDKDDLTDAFEQMLGLDPSRADTDADGLPDADEVALSGTSGTTWDSDDDGASDGVEVRYGSDPLAPLDGSPAAGEAGGRPAAGGPETVPAVAGAGGAGAAPGEPAGDQSESLTDAFLREALAQEGDRYVFGAEASLDDENPDTFDCSELTQWAADQVGVTIPDGAMYQYLDLKNEGQVLGVDEALRTPGALLFYFSEEPVEGGSRPGSAHVAISLGDGRTIEARGSDYGVMIVGAEENEGRFNYAGVIPEMEAGSGTDVEAMVASATAARAPTAEPGSAAAGTDADRDGLEDAFEESLHLDPNAPDSDGDGTLDAEEVLVGSGPLTRAEVRAELAEQGLQGRGDADSDGLENRDEIRLRLDPRNADSDGDLIGDSYEIAQGTDPGKLDTDLDGLSDKFELDHEMDPLTAGNPTDGWGFQPADPLAPEFDDALQTVDDGSGLD